MNFAKLILMVRFLRYIAILVLLQFFSCSTFGTKKSYKLDPEFKTFFNFNNGSKWKYSLSTDTTFVETVELAGHKEGKMVWDEFTQEFFEYDFISNTDSLFKLRAVADDGTVSNATFLAKDTGFKTVAEWVYSSGKYTSLSGNNDTLNLLKQFTVRGVTYPDVLEIIPARKTLYKKFFWARHIGIIRKESTKGKIYLLNSFTVQ